MAKKKNELEFTLSDFNEDAGVVDVDNLESEDSELDTELQLQTTEAARNQIEYLKKTSNLSPVDYRLLNYMAIGHTVLEASRKFKRSNTYINLLIKKDCAQKYLLYLTEGYKEQCFASKNDIIRDLAVRIQTATNRDAVQLIKTMSELLGWTSGDKNKVEININWGEDPWANTIDISSTESTTEGGDDEG